VAFDDASQILYVADTDNNRIRAVIGGTEQTTTVAGRNHQGEHNGAGLAATFRYPIGLALDPTRRILYVADNGNHLIRYIELGPAVEHVAPESVVVKTLAGVGMHGGCDGGPEVAAFNSPGGLWHDPVQNVLYVSDSHRIRAVGAVGHPRQGTVATVAGTSKPGYTDGAGSVAQFASPGHLSGDAEKRVLYIADSLNHRVRRLSLDGFKGDPTTHSEL
jgi:serine/threonine-protein kinase